jgi:hypothetical protein
MHRLCESESYGHIWLYKEQGRQECLRCNDSRAYAMAKGRPVFDTAIAPILAPPVAVDATAATAGSDARDYLAGHR